MVSVIKGQITLDLNVISDIIIPVIILFFNHLFSFFYNRKVDIELARKKSIVQMMFMPYLRIIPMGFVVVFGSLGVFEFNNSSNYFFIFIILKIIMDIFMHILEHKHD